MAYSGSTKGFMYPPSMAEPFMDLYVPRSNVGMASTHNSMIAQGDFPTELQTVELRPKSLPIVNKPEGDIEEGVSLAGTLYPQSEY